MPPISTETLARLLPDLPRWVEIRSLLLSGPGLLVGARAGALPSFLVFEPNGLAGVVGRPPADVIRTAAVHSRELLAAPEDADWVTSALPDWKRERVTIHLLDSDARLPAVPPGTVRPAAVEELFALPDPALREELLSEASEGTRVVAALVDGLPVAFCYAGSETERWWDLSIDTLEPYRRQGHAARCAAFYIREMAALGKQPIWGAVASNAASLGLAAKLGFRPIDTTFLFSRPELHLNQETR